MAFLGVRPRLNRCRESRMVRMWLPGCKLTLDHDCLLLRCTSIVEADYSVIALQRFEPHITTVDDVLKSSVHMSCPPWIPCIYSRRENHTSAPRL